MSASPGLAVPATASPIVGEERVARAFHAGDVEPLLVAEVVVEEGLGDPDLAGDVVHRHRGEAALGEELMGDRERLLHAVAA